MHLLLALPYLLAMQEISHLIPFLTNKYMSMSSNSFLVILSFAFQLNPGLLK